MKLINSDARRQILICLRADRKETPMRQIRYLIVVAILSVGMFTHMAIAASHCHYCDSTGYGGRCPYSPTGHHSHIPGRSNWEESGSDRSIDRSMVPHVSRQKQPLDCESAWNEREYGEVSEQDDGVSISDLINEISVKKIPW